MVRRGVIVVALVSPLLAFIPGSSLPSETSQLDRVRWLTGCWLEQSSSLTIEEQWMAPRGRSMLGMGRTVRNDSLLEYEVVVLTEQGGQLAYEAHPSGQEPATFVSGPVSDSMVVFLNPAHDFPQRVGYRRVGADSLLAWIDGTVAGRQRRVEFPYHRVPCP